MARRCLALALLVGVGVVAGLALVEGLLRLAGYHGAPQSVLSNMRAVDDPVLDWRYVPNSQVRQGRLVVAYNSAGFRDVEPEPTQAAARHRIVILGDSVTEGYGLDWDAVFASRVRAALGSHAQVLNLAMQGLNTAQEVHLLEREGLRFEPTLVVVNFVLNDCDFFTSLTAARRVITEKDSTLGLLGIRISPGLKRLLKSSALVHLAKDRVQSLQERLAGVEQTDYFTSIWRSEQNRHMVTGALDRLQALSRQHSFEVLVVVWPLLTDYAQYDRFRGIHAWTSSQVEARGFASLDLLPAFMGAPYRDLQVSPADNIHPNARGHQLAADAFLTWLATARSTR